MLLVGTGFLWQTILLGQTIVKFRSIHGISILALMVCSVIPVFVDSRAAAVQGEPPIDPPGPAAGMEPGLLPRGTGDTEEARVKVPRGHSLAALKIDSRLVGTVVADPPGRSLAIFENESTGEQRGYLVGDQLGEAHIKDILFGKVVIRTSSGDAVLSVKSKGTADAFIAPLDETPPLIGHLNRQEFDAVLPDYTHLISEIRMRPRFDGGRPKGFVIYNIAPQSLLGRMGLKDGDLIVGVNDTSFSTTQPVVEFYETLKAGGTASFKVERDGHIRELYIEFTD